MFIEKLNEAETIEASVKRVCSKVMLKYFRKFTYDYEAEVDQDIDQIYITISDPTFGDFADKFEVKIVIAAEKAKSSYTLRMGEIVQTSETTVESFTTFTQLAKNLSKIQTALDGRGFAL